MARPKLYDRAYFDRWYRSPREAKVRAKLLRRQARLAVSVAEFLLERPIQDVLDIGCGEGRWRAALRRMRPQIRYRGIDSSEYVCARFGRRRNIVRGSLGELESLGLRGPFDLIVCADVLHYLPTAELRRGLRSIARRLRGVAYLELFTREDASDGDEDGFKPRSAASYRRLFQDAGLYRVGLHCFVGRNLATDLAEFESRGFAAPFSSA